jgi:hypothetical protein
VKEQVRVTVSPAMTEEEVEEDREMVAMITSSEMEMRPAGLAAVTRRRKTPWLVYW